MAEEASIYADGHGITLHRGTLDSLVANGLIRPHPGRGQDGITHDDYILSPGIEWDDVYAALSGKQ